MTPTPGGRGRVAVPACHLPHQSPQRLSSRWEDRRRKLRIQPAAAQGRTQSPQAKEGRTGLKAASFQAGPRAMPTLASRELLWADSLPNLIDDFLLLLNFIPKSGQLLLVSFPVALHLLLQRLLQARPREMCHPLVGSQPTP